MKDRFVLAYDLGTTGCKAVLFSSGRGHIIGGAFQGYETRYPQPTWAEQDPDHWWAAVCRATAEILSLPEVAAKDIVCISFSGQMMGCVPVDHHVQPLRPAIIWADQRSLVQADQIASNVGLERAYQITGHRVSPSYSAAKIMWLRDNEPDVFKKTFKFLQAKDYVAARLTGVLATDYSDASGTNLFDLRELRWSDELLAATGVPKDKLPEAFPSTAVIGVISAEGARATGLLEGTPVVIGGGDGACAAAGAGVVGSGVAYNYVGSSSWIGVATPEPLYDQKMRTFNWVHVVPGLYSPTGTMQAAGTSYQWLRDQICALEVETASRKGASPYELMDEMAAAAPPGADRLLFLPYLVGERSPRWNPRARGAFIGLTVKHTRSHLIRSVMEGVAFNLKVILEAFLDQGTTVGEMRLIGGAAKSDLWSQIMADVYQVPLYRNRFPLEATSLGAALVGGVGIGILADFSAAAQVCSFELAHLPRAECRDVYRTMYELFQQAYENLVPVFEELGSP